MQEETLTQEQEAVTPRQTLLNEIGRKLSAAREQRGESIDAPARLLKLSRSNLTSLESGNWKDLPDEVYALGFLRQYSQHLNVDICHELELLKNDQYQLTKPLTFPDPAVAPSRQWAWIAGIAFVVLFILFNIISRNSSDSESIETQDEFAPATQSEMELQPTDPSEVMPDEQAPTLTAADTTTETTTAVAEPVVAAREIVEAKPATTPQKHLYRFEAANGDVWLQIFLPDENGSKQSKPHREALLKQGYHVNVSTTSESLWITCGNAPGLRIKVDGKVAADTGALSNNRKILRDHLFTIK